MLEWYDSLDTLQRIFAYIAIPSTVVLLLQTILFLVGVGNGDADADGDPSTGDDGMALFSIRGIIAMLCVGGWSGIALGGTALPDVAVVLIAVLCGFAALLVITFLIRFLMKLQSNGNIELSRAIGKTGQVYIPIPPEMSGKGKVNIILQDVYSEFSAMTTEPDTIKTGDLVRVVATDETGMLIVERVNKGSAFNK